MQLQISIQSARGRSQTITAERLVNMYAEKQPQGAEAPVALLGAPGLALHVALGAGPCRGMVAANGVIYAVTGTSLYSFTGAGVGTLLGTVPGTGLVSMAASELYVVIVTSPNGYYYDVTANTFAQITDVNYAGAHSVIWVNEYFYFANNEVHFIGDVGGLLPFDALMSASAEYAPDAIRALARDHNEVLIFGETTLESWQNVQVTDATAYPFDLITGAVGEKGIASPYALASLDNTTVWLDQNGIVRRLSAGYTPTRISTEAIEYQIAQGDTGTASMFVYVIEGHECFALSMDVGTFVFDANTQAWHERQSYGINRWRAQCSAFLGGQWYVGDYVTGNIYRLDSDVNDENGQPLVASMHFPPIVNQRKRFTINCIELGADVGAGTLTADPQITLFISPDGYTWANGRSKGMGFEGQRTRRVWWDRCGQWQKAHIRLDVSDAYKRCVYAAYAELEQNDR